MFFGIIIILALLWAMVSESHVEDVNEVTKGLLADKMYSQLR